MNSKAALGFLAVLAAFIVLIGWVKKRATQLDTESEALRVKVAELQKALAAANAQQGTEKSETLAQPEKLELMRLRNEVTQLRAGNLAAEKLEAENARLLAEMEKLQAGASNSTDPDSSQRFPLDQWSFRGYSTPESAYISFMWGMKEGQVETVLDSVIPEERQRIEAQDQGKTPEEISARFQKEFGSLNSVQIMRKRQTSPTEVVLDVYMDGARTSLKRVQMTQVGTEWKAGVAPKANGEYDPLAFYRKNPELMKRYFPHLFKEGAAEQAQSEPGQGAQAIADRYGLGSAAPAE